MESTKPSTDPRSFKTRLVRIGHEGTLFGNDEHLSSFENFTENLVNRPFEGIERVFSPANSLSFPVVYPYERRATDRYNTGFVSAVFINDSCPCGVQCTWRHDPHPDAIGEILGCVSIEPVVR